MVSYVLNLASVWRKAEKLKAYNCKNEGFTKAVIREDYILFLTI